MPRVVLLLLLLSHPAAATAPPQDLPVSVEAEAPSGVQASGRLPLPSFRLAAGESLLPGLPAVDWTADLALQVRPPGAGEWRPGLEVRGGVATLTAGETGLFATRGGPARQRVWAAWSAAEEHPVTLRIRFTRAGEGEARLRLLWEQRPGPDGEGALVAAEPVPGWAILPAVAAAEDPGLLPDRLLLSRLGCVQCHVPAARAWTTLTAFPAPDLGRVGERLRPDWIRRWISDPQGLKPDCGMPNLLAPVGSPLPEGRAEDVEALLQFLLSTGAGTWRAPAREEAALALGRRLYHEVGCVACHGPLEPAADVFGDPGLPSVLPSEAPPIPLPPLSRKWLPGGLARFLEEPRLAWPDGRMPSLGLTAQEADLITAYLLDRDAPLAPPPAPPEAPEEEQVERGRELYARLGCGACHDHAPGHLVELPRLEELEVAGRRGCLDPSAASAPRYAFVQRAGADGPWAPAGRSWRLEEALRRVSAASGAPAPADEAERVLTSLACLRCHTRSGRGGPPAGYRPFFRTLRESDIGDEGRLPPDLGDVGFRLTSSWLREVLVYGSRARPAMATRMPRFGLPAAGLPELFAAVHGLAPDEDLEAPPVRDAMVRAGRFLAGGKGMDCLSCHGFGEYASMGAPAMDGFAGRLRHEWWIAYAPDPARLKPGTRMPRFLERGRSAVTSVLGGDGPAQIEALWAWFSMGETAPPPDGLPARGGLQLAVGERPRVVRALLRNAGARGLAIGFPAGLHFAYDASEVRLVEAWRDPFLDMSGSWTARGGAVLGGQGAPVWTAPSGPTLLFRDPGGSWPAEGGAVAGQRFLGYRLLADGTPVLRCRLENDEAAVEVEEQLRPVPEPGILFRRRFTVRGLPPGGRVWLQCGPPGAAAVVYLENSGLAAQRTVLHDGEESLLCAVLPFDHTKPMIFALEVPAP